ncbi:hypothetical protein BH11MYX4_BH11MYX4_41910 [soil metagenome]
MCKLHLSLVVAGALGLLGCKTETALEDYPCPPAGTKLTYDSFGSGFMARSCQTCHGQSDGARKGAPEGYDFGTLEAVRAQKDRIFARAAADNVTMPPGPDDPPAAERDQLAEWLACGAP